MTSTLMLEKQYERMSVKSANGSGGTDNANDDQRWTMINLRICIIKYITRKVAGI